MCYDTKVFAKDNMHFRFRPPWHKINTGIDGLTLLTIGISIIGLGKTIVFIKYRNNGPSLED